MSHTRAIDLNTGVAMVVTDLHGHLPAYEYIRDTFLHYRDAGQADYLILCGDLIHSQSRAEDDYSVPMLLDVMRLQEELGASTVILLMGNHEMSHVYNITLAKGEKEYTSRFEHALHEQVDEAGYRAVMAFLAGLPLCVRTSAGVMMTHAGASPAVKTVDDAELFLTFDHNALLYLADDYIQRGYDLERLRTHEEYRQQVAHYFAIIDVHHPRYHHMLRGQIISQTIPEFQFLWQTLFNRNEQDMGANYKQVTTRFLDAISSISPYDQHIIVSGHMAVSGGHKVVHSAQLRLASYAHAQPNDAGAYLLLDCAHKVTDASELVADLHPVNVTKNAP